MTNHLSVLDNQTTPLHSLYSSPQPPTCTVRLTVDSKVGSSAGTACLMVLTCLKMVCPRVDSGLSTEREKARKEEHVLAVIMVFYHPLLLLSSSIAVCILSSLFLPHRHTNHSRRTGRYGDLEDER